MSTFNLRLEEALSKIDPEELKKGIKTEFEHTSDPKMDKKIAMDHLEEDPKYYTS